ncbi:MAG: HAMP domain-containing histidine kinase, partial [Methylococcales bacterium]|nr:HAMP domain-containing histidine kinase [Methylococcales bacterium]
MNTLPLLVRQYLSRLWLDSGKFAYLSFNKQGLIQSWHPDIEYYGVIGLQLNDHVSEKLLFLEGWFSCDQDNDVFVLDFINFDHGIIADIHVLPSRNETYILFVDVSEKFRQHQSLQQERHNFDLLNQQQVKNIEIFRQNFQELDANKRQIETINESKNKLLSCITDDLRAPLSGILGFAQFLDSGVFGDLNSKQRECVGNMLKAGSCMTGLINEILEVARLEKDDLTLCIDSFSIKNLIDECLKPLVPLIQAYDIKLVNHIDEDIEILVDRVYFQQVITNLIDNAMKYNKKNGCIIISYRILEGKLCLYIKDTGIGISLDKIDQIFQPFVRNFDTQDKLEGTEIGLSGCKRLLGLMSGTLSVRSTLSVGSIFYLEVPLSTPCEGRDKYH